MKTLILLAAALSLRAETFVQWNVQNVDELRRFGLPIPSGSTDAVVVIVEQRDCVQVGRNLATGTDWKTCPSAFLIDIWFDNAPLVRSVAIINDYGSGISVRAAARIPIPKGLETKPPLKIHVVPVYMEWAAPATDVTP